MNLLVLVGLTIAVPSICPSVWVLSAPTGSDVKMLPNAGSNAGGHTKPVAVEVLDIPEITEQDAVENLESLGYSDSEDGFTIGTRFNDPNARSELYRTFQRDYGLPQTGILDEETRVAINSPKCGLMKSDKTVGGERVWDKNRLTYRISNYPNGVQTTIIKNLIRKAFEEWSKVTNLDFVEVHSKSVDIDVSFGGRTHNRRDEKCGFDSPRTLAHAFFPEVGDLHFNTNYFFNSAMSLADFFDTALHEIGHSLGLEHINSAASLMHPTASNQFTKPQPIDVQKIQSLYGVRKSATLSATSSAPKFCTLPKMDAVFRDTDGSIYTFAGDYYYNMGDDSPIGRLISSKWPGLPGRIDAVFQWTNGKTYFFKRDKFWRFNGNRLEAGYPRLISKGFPGLPSNVDGLMVDGDGDIFAFKGGLYWTYYPGIKKTSKAANIARLESAMPTSVDAALNTNTRYMFFKGVNFYILKSRGGVEVWRNSWFEC